MGAFGKGFMGCFGMLGAMVLALFALVMCGTIAGDRKASAIREGRASPHDYLNFCSTAFVGAKHLVPSLRNAEQSIADPTILSKDRIQCAYTDARGQIGAITADILCSDPLTQNCVQIVAVIRPNGRTAYTLH